MKMTRQHFEALAFLTADNIEIVIDYIGRSEIDAIIKNTLELCKSSNKLFDEKKFTSRVFDILEARNIYNY